MLKGKTALITGSTSGIGLGIARAMAGQGCRIMLNGLGDPERIKVLRSEIESEYGTETRFHGADMTCPDQIAALVESAAAAFGSVDILVNCAGVQHTAPVEKFPPERWAAIIAINLSSSFYTIHHAIPYMQRNGWGRIINIASVHGLVASANKAAYVSAKHGLVGLTKVVALETAGSGITSNAICPGWTRTELIEPQIIARAETLGVDIEAGGRDLLAEKQPSRQFVSIEQLGQLALFLCSPAADQITGAAMPIDGGWTAQ
ncbi:3-hydroxybutyrate dehydrogenase [Geobacter sp. SVR]|uniref:3-hydroxybutyrate dehydrogenase n=1 Tax=Geobacter sp. SVR TaxID=2495594 RepID=UPI00143F00D4|nr:3-hydroxybutyrate dehydrogenase [Geobacter sp. SVR]BCS55781.1 3-hydroxybutyrate dehydrogenase [Geobacter sp. SVR]GCF83785.1 3-hydroxybutyrate dehydrogenase [Geobacter sp. SVR]